MAMVEEKDIQSYRMPNALIHSPRMVSFLAASTLDAILINEQLNPRKRGETKNKIRIKDLRWIANLDNSNNTDILEKVLDELLTVSAKWNMFGDDPDFIDVKATNFLQDYSYRKRSKDGSLDIERGFINYRLTQTVVEIIDKKTRETELNVISAKIFEKPYTERLYQLGKSFLGDKDECEEEKTVTETKEFLGVGDKYETFKGFNYEILKPSLKEISEESDIEMKVARTIRKSRNIHKLVFYVRKKDGFQMTLPFSIETIPEIFRRTIAETEENIRRENIIKRLKSFRMSDQNVKKVMARENHDLNVIEDRMMQAERQVQRGYKYRFGNRKFRHDFILYGWKYIENQDDNSHKPSDEQKESEKIMRDCGVNGDVAMRLARDHDLQRIKENIDLAKKEFEAGNTKTTLAAHVVSAVKSDYRPKKSPFEAKKDAEKEVQAKAVREQALKKEIAEQESALKREFDEESREEAVKIYRGLPKQKQEDIYEEIIGSVRGYDQKMIEEKRENNIKFQWKLRDMIHDQLSPIYQDFDGWKNRRMPASQEPQES